MRLNEIAAEIHRRMCEGRRKRGYSSYKGAVGKVAANVLAGDFSASRPMEKLVSDVTQFDVGGAKVYLSPLIDLYNGEVVAWRSGRSPSIDFVLGMLADAEGRLAGSGAVVHTDSNNVQSGIRACQTSAVSCVRERAAAS